MSVIEGIFHNPDTGIDERRLIACDTEGRLLGAQALGSSESGMRTDVFAIGRLGRGESAKYKENNRSPPCIQGRKLEPGYS
jgi:hypothetical protein